MTETMTIAIPVSLARLLVAKREGIKDGTKYEDVQDLAKSLLTVLMAAEADTIFHQLKKAKKRAKLKPSKYVATTTKPKRKKTVKERKAISRRMKAYWREKRGK